MYFPGGAMIENAKCNKIWSKEIQHTRLYILNKSLVMSPICFIKNYAGGV